MRKEKEIQVMSLENVPPNDIATEKQLLGTLLCDETLESYYSVSNIISADDFYLDAHQRIYNCFALVANEHVQSTIEIICNKLQNTGQLAAVGGVPYVAELMQGSRVRGQWAIINANYYANIIRQYSRRRQAIQTSSKLIQSAYDPSVEIDVEINRYINDILDLNNKKTSTIVTAYDIIKSLCKSISTESYETESKFFTQLKQVDKLLSIRPGQLVIIAARPGKGKSTLALNIAENIAVNYPTLFVSLEMTGLEIAERLLQKFTKCSCKELAENNVRYQKELDNAIEQFRQCQLYFDCDGNRTIIDIISMARKLKHEVGLQCLIVDYIGLVEGDDKYKYRYEKVTEITHMLKRLAMDLNIPVIALAQINRESESKENKRPGLSNLRDSGSLEQDADVVMIIHSESDEEWNERNKDKLYVDEIRQSEIIIAKNRQGPTGSVRVNFNRKLNYFYDLDAKITVNSDFGEVYDNTNNATNESEF